MAEERKNTKIHLGINPKILAGLGTDKQVHTPSYISQERAEQLKKEIRERKDLLCLIEGAWTPRTGTAMQEYVKKLSSMFNLAGIAVSWEAPYFLVPFIQEASKNRGRIYLGGFSLGDDMAEKISRNCRCSVEKLFLLDGTHVVRRIPSNVKKAVYIGSEDSHDYVSIKTENSSTLIRRIKLFGAGHLDVPEQAFPYVAEELAEQYT